MTYFRMPFARGTALLCGVLALAGCGPDVDELPFDVVGVYTERLYWHNGEILGTPSSIELRSDGTVLWVEGGCPGTTPNDTPGEWERRGRTISVYGTASRESVATLKLSAEQCGAHDYKPSFSRHSRPYVAGRYCLTGVQDNGHAGWMCEGWEPCDEVAEVCAAIFDAEAEAETETETD